MPISRRGAKIWNYVDYTHAFVAANKMINDEDTYGDTVSGLITGKQWDAIMKWYKNSGIGIGSTDGAEQDWGNYRNLPYSFSGLYFTNDGSSVSTWSKSTAAVSHTATSAAATASLPYHYLGAGESGGQGEQKHISDIAGNVWEWSAEVYNSSYRVSRGGSAYDTTSVYPASFRDPQSVAHTGSGFGFRCVLYVQ